MKRRLANLVLCAFCIGGVAAQSSDDSTRTAMREEDFLRWVGDLGLARALEDLEQVEPAAKAIDRATPQLREMTRLRMTLKNPITLMGDRIAAGDQLRKARGALVASRLDDPRSMIWLTDAAEDEFSLGFLGLDGGPEAIAGSPVNEILPRANASLDRIVKLLDQASALEQSIPRTHIPIDSLLMQRLDDDARGRRPMLAAAAQALRLVIDRSGHDAQKERDRTAEGEALLARITALRPEIPERMRAEADLAEIAAATVAVQLDNARFGAARVLLANDSMLTILSHILAAECMVNAQRGPEALKQLAAIFDIDKLHTALRLLTADALVRARLHMGKSPASEETIRPWIATLQTTQPLERAGVRLAVLERLAGSLRGARIDAPLAPLAAIAVARDRLLSNPQSTEEIEILRQFAAQATDAQAQATAIIVLAEVHARQADWPSAAEDYRQFAEVAAQEPMALPSMQTAIDIELALDRADPSAREHQLERTLALAVNRFAELPSRPCSRAQWEAIKARKLVSDVLARSDIATADEVAAITLAATRIDELDAIARRAGFDPGPRVNATAYAAKVAADFLSPSHAQATRAQEIPTAAQWDAWTNFDAQRILRLRLERAARHETPARTAFAREFAALPARVVTDANSTALTSLVNFMRSRVARAATMNAAGNLASIQNAQCALDAVEAWERIHPASDTAGPQRELEDLCARLAADAAFLAQSWDSAVARADALARRNSPLSDDIRRQTETLSAAEIAASRTGDNTTRDALRTRAMASARELAACTPQASKEWWMAQLVQLRIAQESGRGGESVQARIARLRAIDANLGGASFREEFERIAALPQPSGSL